MMTNSIPENSGDDIERIRSESVLREPDDEARDGDTAVTHEDVAEALEITNRMREEVEKYEGVKMNVHALKHLLTPHSTIEIRNNGSCSRTREKVKSAEYRFLRLVVEKYIQQYENNPTLRAFTLFLRTKIQELIDQEEQTEYAISCNGIVAEFLATKLAHQREEYPRANEEERDAIISDIRNSIDRVISHVVDVEENPDTTPPSSEVPPQN